MLPAPTHAPTLALSDCSDLSLSHPDDARRLARPLLPLYARAHRARVKPPQRPMPFPHKPLVLAHAPRPAPLPARSPGAAASAAAPAHKGVARPPHAFKHAFKHAPPKKVRSSKSNIPGESRYWTPSEHKLFVEALLKYGPKNLKAISAYVGTRNMIQCRTHEQKCFMRLMREAQRETFLRDPHQWESQDKPSVKCRPQKDVYSVPPSCGITLLCVVGEEMQRSLQS